MNGDGGWTNVAGDKVPLKPGDIVYCGPNFWHDHKNEGSTDMVFLDVLDIPLLQYLGVSEWYFNAAEVSGSKDEIHHPVTHSPDFDNSHKSRIQPTARPRFEAEQRKYNEVQHFSFEDTKTLFDSLMNEDGSPFDDLIIQFQNPHTHNPVGPTVDICSQMIRPGVSTSTHRHTWATICMVAEGQGDIVVDGKTVPFKPNDIFVIPGWAWHHWKNSHDTPCIVHSISDYALLERIGFAREQSEEADTGWQPIPFTRITRD
jgi:gentisate 1,2-dioxygenase